MNKIAVRNLIARILEAADSGDPVAIIAKKFKVSPGRVYRVLDQHRPNRKRTPRTRTSPVPSQIVALAKSVPDTTATRIAFLLKVSRAYVYRILAEEGIVL